MQQTMDTASESPQTAPLVTLRGASVSRGGARLLDAVDFRLLPGERWAVLGANGAGKTTFLRLLRGDIPPDTTDTAGGGRLYDFPGQGGPQKTPLGLRQRLGLVSGDMQDAFAVHGWPATGLEAVLAGFFDAALLYGEATPEQRRKAQATLEALGLSDLARRRVRDMSSGQARKILLARALACGPDVLVLDECLEGLDRPSRKEFLAVLDHAAAADPRLALLYSSHRLDELPACLTLGVALSGGRIAHQGPLHEVLAALAPTLDGTTSTPMPAHAPPVLTPSAAPPRGFLVRITDASVDIDETAILKHISWTIRPGEHWAVLGENGAGKSTLLALLAGEIWPSALNGPPGLVEHGFALSGTTGGETLDDSRKRIGRVSEALQTTFPYDLRVLEAVCTGLTGSLDVFTEPGAAGTARAEMLLDFFGLAALAGRRIKSLSRGQFRHVLLARALIGTQTEGGLIPPALLLLDEPMAGLDTRSRRATRELLGRLAAAGVPLVVVTHHERDLPDAVNRVLALEAGRVIFSGERSEYAKKQAARQNEPPEAHHFKNI